MSHVDVQSAINAVVPCTHMAWPSGKAPESLPWAVFYLDESDGLYADGIRYVDRNSWVVELYMKSRDAELESRIDAAITDSFGAFRKTEAWVASEQCLQIAYYFTEIQRLREVNHG